MLNFNAANMRYEPYPLAVLNPAMDRDLYNTLVENFPDQSLFEKLPKHDYKISLSEKRASKNYHAFLSQNEPWRKFHAWVKSEEFIRSAVDFLHQHHVDLPLDEAFEDGRQKLRRFVKAVKRGYLPSKGLRLRSRFEFSALKADGGRVEPHTDASTKLITFVLTMIKDGEWDPSYGGGLEVNRTSDPRYAYNWQNAIVPWESLEVVDTIPFVPNQCTIFVKTHNSLHAVREMTQKGSDALRKSVTIVIEKVE